LQVTSIFILFRYFFMIPILNQQFLHYLVSLVFYVQLWTHCNDFGFLCRWWHSSYSQISHWRCGSKSVSSSPTWNNFFSFNSFLNTHYIVKVTNTELQDIKQLMGYRDVQWYIKDTWIGFSVRNIAKQAVEHCTLWLLRQWAV